VFTGLAMFVPYLGFGLGLVLALLAGLLEFAASAGPAKALLMVAVVYGLGQLIESFVLTPRLVGERIGLHPLAVIFALLAFGQLLGFVGVLMALPASAVLLVAIRRAWAAIWAAACIWAGERDGDETDGARHRPVQRADAAELLRRPNERRCAPAAVGGPAVQRGHALAGADLPVGPVGQRQDPFAQGGARGAARAGRARRLDGRVHGRAAEPYNEAWAAVLLDDVHLYTAVQQHAAFNWFVNAQTHQRWVLAAGDLPPAALQVRDDLRTRLGWGHVFGCTVLSEPERRAVCARLPMRAACSWATR
jgi:hypothetical protein